MSGHVLDLVPASQPGQRPGKCRALWPSGIRAASTVAYDPAGRPTSAAAAPAVMCSRRAFPQKVIRAARPPCGGRHRSRSRVRQLPRGGPVEPAGRGCRISMRHGAA